MVTVAKHDWLRVEGFDDLLDSLSLRSHDSADWVPVRICDEQEMIGMPEFPPVDLWLKVGQLTTLDRLRRLIGAGLKEIGHPVSSALIDSLLPLIPITPGRGREKLSTLFSNFKKTTVSQTLILPFDFDPTDSDSQVIKVGQFSLGPFRSAPKIVAAVAARSPLGVDASFLESQDGHWCVERSLEAITYFDSEKYRDLLENAVLTTEPQAADLPAAATTFVGAVFFENYGSHYEEYLNMLFLEDLRMAQAPYAVLGSYYFPVRELLYLEGCAFLNLWADASFDSSRGILIASVVRAGIELRLVREFSGLLSWISNHKISHQVLGTLGEDEFLRTFSSLIVMAREQQQRTQTEVAFILCCTALEYLAVGTSETIARTLARRLAAIQAFSGNLSYSNSFKYVQSLYDIRSRFAHRAEAIDAERLDQLLELCSSCYLAASSAWIGSQIDSDSGETKKNWVENWRTALDYVAASLAASMTIEPKGAEQAGLLGLETITIRQ